MRRFRIPAPFVLRSAPTGRVSKDEAEVSCRRALRDGPSGLRRANGYLFAGMMMSAALAMTPTAGAAPAPIAIISPAFAHQREVPKQFTCDGAGISPELRWTGIPDGAKSLVLMMTDPDAPDPAALKRHLWVHWVLYNIPPSATGLPADVAPKDLPPGTRPGINGWNKTGYGGPCPPAGRHRYFFRLFALDTVLPDLKEPDRAELQRAMTGHVIGTGYLIGTYAHR